MKKTVITIFVLAVLLASSGQVFGCSLCESLKKLGYSNREIVSLISGSATRAEAENRMRQTIFRGGVSLPKNRPAPRVIKATAVPVVRQQIKVARQEDFRYSNQTIEVPADNKER